MTELMANVNEAIELCLEVHKKDGVNIFDTNFIEAKNLEWVI